jgi:O-methyltransferase
MPLRHSPFCGQLAAKAVGIIARITGGDQHLMHFQMKWLAASYGYPADLVESCLPSEKKKALLECVASVRAVPGDIVECGVYRAGGTVLVADALQAHSSSKHIYGFDTFEGMPEALAQDGMPNGKKKYGRGVLGNTSLALVNEKIRLLGHSDRVSFHKGYFQITLPRVVVDTIRVSLAMIDCDQYAGARFCLEFLYPRVNAGGMILIDDYSSPNESDTPGVKIAVEEFMRDKPEGESLKALALSLYGFVKV